VLPDETKESIHAFVRANVAPGATLLTDGHTSYLGLNEGLQDKRYVLDQRVVGNMAAHLVLRWIHRVFSLVKRWGMGTFHGFRSRHLDSYLEEYAFRFNRRYWRGASFDRIISLAADHAPHDYAAIVGHKPRQGRSNPPRRITPRRRKTADGMRVDGATANAAPEKMSGAE
jgi:transposase-like protein